MKKLILFLLIICSVFLSRFTKEAGAQDDIDTNYVEADEFNHGEFLMIDSTDGAPGNIIVGSSTGILPYRHFLMEVRHLQGSAFSMFVLHNTTGATITSVDTSTTGTYLFTFSSNIFSGKKTHIVEQLILYPDEFTEQPKPGGYFLPQLSPAGRYNVGGPTIQMYAIDMDQTSLLDHRLYSTFLEIRIYD